MRPRQSRLGISARDNKDERMVAASMRPRQSRLGIEILDANAEWRKAGFNEAEAITPRNPGTAGILIGESFASFNEAEAITPRNQGRRYGGEGRCVVASMRPRQSRLGILTGKLVRSATDRASMRPRQSRLGIRPLCAICVHQTGCFNEAEAITPRNRSCVGAPDK